MIGWYVHHVGRGHATRALAVARHLEHEVTGLGSSPAPEGWPGSWVRLERDDRGGPRAEDADVTAHGRLHWVPRHGLGLAERHARIARWVATRRPALLVADVSVEVALLARLSGVPVAVVALPGRRVDPAHTLAYDVADSLLAPWPAGTHERGWPARWRRKVVCVGAVGRYDERSASSPGHPGPPEGGGRRALLLWGGGGRSTTTEEVAAARRATPGWEWVERDPSSPGSLWDALRAADVVVTHAGQNAVAEVAAARRPAVVVAQPRPFDEQVATARVVDERGLAVGLTAWPTASAWPELLARALGTGGQGWSAWSPGDGARVAARHLDDLARSALTGAGT